MFTPADQPGITFVNPQLSSSPGVSYQWFYDQQALPGDTNQMITPLSNGDYTVQVWDSIGCSSISAAYTFLLSSFFGVSESLWEVYPNPAINYFIVSGLQYGDLVEVGNQSGGEVVSVLNQENNDKLVIDINFLAQGVYTVSISNNSEIVHKKIVVAR